MAGLPKDSGHGGDQVRLSFKYFRGTWSTWDSLFSQAAQFATELGPERVVSISHSSDQNVGVVTVWYWSTQESMQTG